MAARQPRMSRSRNLYNVDRLLKDVPRFLE